MSGALLAFELPARGPGGLRRLGEEPVVARSALEVRLARRPPPGRACRPDQSAESLALWPSVVGVGRSMRCEAAVN